MKRVASHIEKIESAGPADADLRTMLAVAGLPVKASYNSAEVCRLLSISYSTFQRMCRDYEDFDGQPRPGTIKSSKLRGQRRIAFGELARFLKASN